MAGIVIFGVTYRDNPLVAHKMQRRKELLELLFDPEVVRGKPSSSEKPAPVQVQQKRQETFDTRPHNKEDEKKPELKLV